MGVACMLPPDVVGQVAVAGASGTGGCCPCMSPDAGLALMTPQGEQGVQGVRGGLEVVSEAREG